MRNKKVLTLVLKVLKHVSCLISRGSELKSLGAATANALSPNTFDYAKRSRLFKGIIFRTDV